MADVKYIPNLRFPEFENDGEWKVVKLGEIFKRITDKNKENNNNVLTISAQDGLVSQYDYFNKNVAANDVTGYYLIKTGDFAYNKSRSQGYPYGAIKPLKLYDKGVVSTLYICFRTKEQNSCIDFYEHYFETDLIHNEIGKIAQEGARNHGLLNISTEDFFEKISLFIPSLPEQQKIAAFLTSLDEQISAHTKKLEALKAHKKGLMQQLFPANGEKTPKLRFPEFKNAGEWKVVKLGEIISVINPPKKLHSCDYRQKGLYPIIDQSQNYICGYTDDNEGLLNKDKDFLIVFGDHTCVLKSVDFPFVQGADGIKIFRSKMIDYVDTIYIYQFLLSKPIVANEYKRHFSELKEIDIVFPHSIQEQHKIASFLSSIDEMIQAQDDKIQKLKTYKNGLMQQMFAVETPYYDVSTDDDKLTMTPYYDISTDGDKLTETPYYDVSTNDDKPMTPYYDVSTGIN